MATAVAVVRRLQRVEVQGASMLPALQPGDRLVVVRGLAVHPGDVVAARDPRTTGRLLVKRVAAVGPRGALTVVGDQPAASTDSRHFGPLPRSVVEGRAVWRYWPVGRRGPVESRPAR